MRNTRKGNHMNTIKAALLAATAFACACEVEEQPAPDKKPETEQPKPPGCGNPDRIGTAKKLIRDEYSMGDRKLELVGIRTTARDAELGNYSCSASVQFEATHGDQIMRKGLMEPPGEKTRIPFRFEIYLDAVDPRPNIVSVKRIPALEVDL